MVCKPFSFHRLFRLMEGAFTHCVATFEKAFHKTLALEKTSCFQVIRCGCSRGMLGARNRHERLDRRRTMRMRRNAPKRSASPDDRRSRRSQCICRKRTTKRTVTCTSGLCLERKFAYASMSAQMFFAQLFAYTPSSAFCSGDRPPAPATATIVFCSAS